jgi:hypothetical protein
MRHTILLVMLPIGLQLSAQSFPFPTSDATWVQYFEVLMPPPPLNTYYWVSTANFCMDGSDTLIAGNSYTRLDYCNAVGYVGGIRSVGEAVYFFPADSTQEYLLYDFGAAVGDTLDGVYVNEFLATGGFQGWQETQLMDLVVTAAAPSSAYGGRIAMQVQTVDPDWGLDSEWIEGIGSIHGLFALNPLNVSKYWYGMQCMSHLGTTYWNGNYTETPGTCAPQNVGFDEKERRVITAYPNPTAGVVRVQGVGVRMELRVHDAIGRTVPVPATRVASDAVELDLGAVPAGMYVLSSMTQGGSWHAVLQKE